MGTTWPFAGRGEELGHLLRLACDPTAQGVLLAGPPGAGKTALATHLTEQLPAGRLGGVLTIRAATALRDVPGGALTTSIPPDPGTARSPAPGTACAAAETVERCGERLLRNAGAAVVTVDDAHLLDRHSAEVVATLVRTGRVRLIATVCSEEALDGPVVELWRDGRLRRFEVEPLREVDVAAVLAAALDGRVDGAAVARLAEITGGNALWLRETVQLARAAGALQRTGGVWRLTGEPPAARGPEELVDRRVGALPSEVGEVLEYAAFGEPVGVTTLAALCSGTAVREAAEDGLITVAAEGRGEVVRPAHPLYGSAARERCPRERRDDRYARLVAAVEADGSGDSAVLAGWRLAGGLEADPGPLLGACRLAGGVHDHPAAIRLGRAAVRAGGGTGAAVGLAAALEDAGQPHQAQAVLLRAEERWTGDDRDRVRLAVARAENLAWGLDRLGDALDLLATTRKEVPDPGPRREADAARAILLAEAARADEALRLIGRARGTDEGLRAGSGAVTAARVAGARALALCHAGRTGEAAGAVQDAARAEEGPGRPYTSPYATSAMCGCFSGDLDLTARAIAAMRRPAGEHGWPGRNEQALAQGRLAMLRGELGAALLILRTAARRETPQDAAERMAAYAMAQALHGDAAGARMSLEAARGRATWTALRHWTALAEVWAEAASGGPSRAVELALAHAEECREGGPASFEAIALHDAVRLGAPTSALPRLSELAAVLDGPRVRLAVRHARALAEGDAAALAEVAAGFDATGLRLFGTEARAQAKALRDGTRPGWRPHPA
ncbi:ATP-binding protein [Nonomuraea sp. NPDC049709]|uniref:ATP-binding protein n=1 Tax=Nonomuraea sp. NPDC049709 TaxID=3154736 RepID=UPI00343A5D4B